MKKTALFVLFVMLAIGVSAQLPSYIPTTGLLAWYPFTGNPNDSSGFLHHGVNHGGTTYTTDRFGNPNSCFRADSLSAIDFPVNNFPTGNAARTVSIFFKLDSPYAHKLRELFAWGDNSSVGGRFGLEINDDTSIGWESTGGAVLSHFKTDTMWHNLTIAYPASGAGSDSIKLFVDGARATVNKIVSPVTILNTATSGSIHLAGALFLSYLYGFYGKLDDLAIWDHELTSCEVERVFYGPVSLVPVITHTGKKLRTDSTYASYQWILGGTPIPGATTDSFTITTGGLYKVAVTTRGGCPDTSLVYNSATLSSQAFSLADAIRIYPNPSDNLFYIESPAPVNMVLTSVTGQAIMQTKAATYVDLRNYPKGMYMITLYDEKGLWLKTERISWSGKKDGR